MDSLRQNGLVFSYDLNEFTFERVLDENPSFHYLAVLGTFPVPLDTQDLDRTSIQTAGSGESAGAPRLPAILRIERTAFSSELTNYLSTGVFTSMKRIGHTDIYSWFHAWLARKDDLPDVKISVIFPATEVHIRKYTKQERIMVTETPDLYRKIVKPFIDAFPASRTQWIRDVLDGKAEAENILCRTSRFVILPDMKWDPSGPISSLYLLAIVFDASIRSLRDLRGGPDGHVGMLEEIRDRAYSIAKERWGLAKGALHHFHVHIVHASQDGTMGMTVGQAHLLEDVISLLKHSPNILSELTLTYGLGSQHGLYDAMVAAQVDIEQRVS